MSGFIDMCKRIKMTEQTANMVPGLLRERSIYQATLKRCRDHLLACPDAAQLVKEIEEVLRGEL